MRARELKFVFARGALLALIGLAGGGSGLAAQDPTSPTVTALIETAADTARRTIFLRAQRLVNDGNGAEGRALLDSLLNATEPRAPEEAEILFWRATLAESWDQAQRDYLRILLEHDRTPLAARAMLRLAQGEITRGDREAALGYLERLAREAPESELRAEAGLWQGRLLIDRGARTDGCAVLRTLRPRVRAGAIELENQYDFLLRGCDASAVAVTPAPPVTPSEPAPSPQAPVVAEPTPPAPTGALVWTVQVAAFQTAAEAQRLADELSARGYTMRVDGIAAPYRVRFGYYDTRAEATAAMTAYRTKERGDAFITQVRRE